ncbi:MAG: glycine/sarcosine/betaine reductase selenoprotein B family protein [Acidimicrobiales bacterium]
MVLWQQLDTTGMVEKYDKWIELIDNTHHAANNRVNPTVSFSPLRRPLAEATVALVSTAGVHLDDQPPFDVATTDGDPTFRLIPDDTSSDRLRFTHTHYDTGPAGEDPNVVFPLDRLHEFVVEGRVGAAAPFHVGLMGFNPDPSRIADDAAPEVARQLTEAEVDVVVLTPG